MRKTLLSVLAVASCMLTAAPAHAVEVSEGDIDFLFVLSRMSPSSHMAALYLANECHAAPTQRFVESVFHTDEYLGALAAFIDRMVVDQPVADTTAPGHPQARPFPEISDAFCDRVKLSAPVAQGF